MNTGHAGINGKYPKRKTAMAVSVNPESVIAFIGFM
jgi:hypothetical protein